jgi:hypothetical protein
MATSKKSAPKSAKKSPPKSPPKSVKKGSAKPAISDEESAKTARAKKLANGGLAVGVKLFHYTYRPTYKDGKRIEDPSTMWGPLYVVAETTQSWVFGKDLNRTDEWSTFKILKSKVRDEEGRARHNLAMNEEEYLRREWVKSQGWRISDLVRSLNSYEKLRAIADIVGFGERPK